MVFENVLMRLENCVATSFDMNMFTLRKRSVKKHGVKIVSKYISYTHVHANILYHLREQRVDEA